MRDDLELNLSMKAVLMYEKLTGAVFSDIMDQEQTVIFMYSIFVCSTDLKITFDTFCTMLEGKNFSNKINKEFKRLWGYTQQFQKAPKKPSESIEETSADTKTTMTEYVNTLVLDYGLDINYIMLHMEFWEIEGLYNAAVSHMQATMEDKRLWAYIQMLPNFDKKHRNMTPEEFLPFPWNTKERKIKREKELEAETARAKNIIGMDIRAILGGNQANSQEKPPAEL